MYAVDPSKTHSSFGYVHLQDNLIMSQYLPSEKFGGHRREEGGFTPRPFSPESRKNKGFDKFKKDQQNMDDTLSAKSRLDEISRSYMSPSRTLKIENVGFEASVMKIGEKDERLTVQIHKALDTQKEIFAQKRD